MSADPNRGLSLLKRRLYYTLKPYIPWRLRVGLRRMMARRKLAAARAVWPIDESAARPPANWPGWPDGKKFAFILTHDVEGPAGLAKCRQLMQLEMEMGFRSSFSFVPEGDYVAPCDLRDELKRNGFEVAVHDHRHDGRLFLSRSGFSDSAKRINVFLRDWNATGFRAGFMFHNLEWVHDLDIEYDCSTFDTDPFEPQPDGVHTIFPFWVPAPADPAASPDRRPGYVELPYTLPQDSTLFLLLREKTSDIWLRKLDWVAEHGGMALVNVHPDYLCFDGETPSPRTFPVKLYAELLQHVRTRYAGAYWQPLAHEVATYQRQTMDLTGPAAACQL